MSYSFIGFQTAYLATHWNPIYWNTSCLIVNSGSLEEENNDDDEEESIDLIDKNENKKVEKATDYGKIAKAIGDIISKGIKMSLVDINNSDYSFKPDVQNNEILFGMKALSNVGGPIIEQIIQNRPYSSLKDFMIRCPLNKTAMINLIKSGAFDKIEEDNLGKINRNAPLRKIIMAYYLSKVYEEKKKLTLQNFNGLLQYNLIPKELDFQKKVFYFNKYLKDNKKSKYYLLDDVAMSFYEKNFDTENLDVIQGNYLILQTKWDSIYKKAMDSARNWLKENQEEVLDKYNKVLFKEIWNKYATGTISRWEMDAMCFYYHEHELKNINKSKYGIVNFYSLAEEPDVDYTFRRNDVDIPIYKIYKIAGTVIGKNDTRSSISLLTTDGVVPVKFTKEYYAMYAKQISEKQGDGTKKVVEKSWFTRGTKLLVQGFKRDNMFVSKTYSKTPGHQLYIIDEIKEDNSLVLRHDRKGNIEE